MATVFDRMRDGLIWGYAALSLIEERRAQGRQWWEQENLRLKEDARARLDDALRLMEERRAQRAEWMNQRAEWMKERVRSGLSDSGLVMTDQIDALQERIDALTARLNQLQAMETTAGSGPAAHIILPTGSAPMDALAADSGAPADATPKP